MHLEEVGKKKKSLKFSILQPTYIDSFRKAGFVSWLQDILTNQEFYDAFFLFCYLLHSKIRQKERSVPLI